MVHATNTNGSQRAERLAEEYRQLLGRRVGDRFELRRLIGVGGAGAVFQAHQQTESFSRDVAVKLIPTRDGDEVLRVEREARLMGQLQHPNTVTLIDFGRTDPGYVYLVMELLEGCSLQRALERDGVLSPRRAVAIAIQALQSLAEAHSHGIVHRDIKPANIYLASTRTQKDFVKLLDFGIAKVLDADSSLGTSIDAGDPITLQGQTVGTPVFMAPEQLLARPVDARSDIYSLGVVLYCCLVGERPFIGRSLPELADEHATLRVSLPTRSRTGAALPRELEAVLARALTHDPERRFHDADEFRQALEDIHPRLEGDDVRGSVWSSSPRWEPLPTPTSQPAPLTGNGAASSDRFRVEPRPGDSRRTPPPRRRPSRDVLPLTSTTASRSPAGLESHPVLMALAALLGCAALVFVGLVLFPREPSRSAPSRPSAPRAPAATSPRIPAPAAAVQQAPALPAAETREPADTTEPADTLGPAYGSVAPGHMTDGGPGAHDPAAPDAGRDTEPDSTQDAGRPDTASPGVPADTIATEPTELAPRPRRAVRSAPPRAPASLTEEPAPGDPTPVPPPTEVTAPSPVPARRVERPATDDDVPRTIPLLDDEAPKRPPSLVPLLDDDPTPAPEPTRDGQQR